jgi:hypothetical protein
MNEDMSRQNIETTIYVVVLAVLVLFLIYDIYAGGQEAKPTEEDALLEELLAAGPDSVSNITESPKPEDTYEVDEQSGTINVTTNISDEEELGELVSDFITDQYFESEGISGEFKSIEPFEEKLYIVTISVEADLLEKSDTKNYVTETGRFFIFSDAYTLNIKLKETPRPDGEVLITSLKEKQLGERTFEYMNEMYFKPAGITAEFKGIEPFEEEWYVVTTSIEEEGKPQNESVNYVTSSGSMFVVEDIINVYDPIVPPEPISSSPSTELFSNGTYTYTANLMD